MQRIAENLRMATRQMTFARYPNFRHPHDPKSAKKIKKIKKNWEALQKEFPHSVVPELIINSPWDQETFAKYYFAMKKAYRPVMNAKERMTKKQERKYKENLRALVGSPDFMRHILGYY